MIFRINDYFFDTSCCILYPSDIEKNKILEFIEDFEKNFDKTRKILFSKDASNNINTRIAFDSCGVMPTYNCNLHCKYCAYSSGENKYNIDVNLNAAKIFLEDMIKRKAYESFATQDAKPLHIDFTGGGEPTYNWNLFCNIVFFAKYTCAKYDVAYTIGMTTNGVLSDEQLDFIINNFNKVMISYDGLPSIQEQNRNQQEKITKVIENSISKLASSEVELMIRTSIWYKDIHLLTDMFNYINGLLGRDGNAVWSIYPIENEGRALKSDFDFRISSLKDLLEFYLDTQNRLSRETMKIGITKIELPIFIKNICNIFCGAIDVVAPWLLPNGEIVTCVASPMGKVVIGKIEENKITNYEKYYDKLLEVTKKI